MSDSWLLKVIFISGFYIFFLFTKIILHYLFKSWYLHNVFQSSSYIHNRQNIKMKLRSFLLLFPSVIEAFGTTSDMYIWRQIVSSRREEDKEMTEEVLVDETYRIFLLLYLTMTVFSSPGKQHQFTIEGNGNSSIFSS